MKSTPEIDFLFEAILSLKDEKECQNFFDDLLTIRECHDMAQRFQVAKYLTQGESYENITRLTGASSATISRVSRCLIRGTGGYRTALDLLSSNPVEREV